MSDPLTEVVKLLQPRAVFANPISGKGDWAVRFAAYGQPSFCIMLAGSCMLAVDGHEAVTLCAGDFVLLPNAVRKQGEVRYGDRTGEADMRSLGGAFLFDAADPKLLVSLLPELVHVQGSMRLAQLVQMVGEEHTEQSPGHEFMLSRLVEMMLIEAMRSTTSRNAPSGLLRGLGDERLAPALKQMHARIDHTWTVAQLAPLAALSRSAFFDRFTRIVGVAPMEYLLAWRMEIARDLLRRKGLGIAQVAERVGYASTSTFSTAFSRHVGQSPRQYARSGQPANR
jgi:AraC-like DNA-binding protein